MTCLCYVDNENECILVNIVEVYTRTIQCHNYLGNCSMYVATYVFVVNEALAAAFVRI